MSTVDDYEESWIERRINGKDIVPRVMNQGAAEICVFCALTSAGEMELKRKAACHNPPKSSKVKFSATVFAADYEREEGKL